jgi:hypothetical protein
MEFCVHLCVRTTDGDLKVIYHTHVEGDNPHQAIGLAFANATHENVNTTMVTEADTSLLLLVPAELVAHAEETRRNMHPTPALTLDLVLHHGQVSHYLH